jgi:WD40 repeat protein
MSDEPGAPSDDELLKSILVDILQAMDAGQPLPPLSEMQARHPKWAEELAMFYDGEELAHALQGLGASPGEPLPAAAAVRPGTRFGNYEVLERLGRGGMGIVYRVRHLLLDKEVALKVVRPDRLEPLSPAERVCWIERFRGEARSVAALDRHPNLVTLFEVGDWAGRPFFTMQLIRGGSLAGRIAARSRLADNRSGGVETSLPSPQPASQADPSPSAAADQDLRDAETGKNSLPDTQPLPTRKRRTSSRRDGSSAKEGADGAAARAARSKVRRADAALLAKVARAVDYAHRRGILHRDLKPGNILLDEDGEPLVSDFGLARRLDETGSLVSGAIEGTAAYMSPEQARGARSSLDVTADVYALGAVLYELLTRQPPFRGMNDVETRLQVINLNPTPPRSIDPSIERDLEIICLACLEKEPGRRYKTAAALAEDLENWLAGRTINARPAGSGERFVRWCRRNPWIAGLGAAALLFLVAGSVASTAFAFRAQANAVESGKNAKQAQDNETIALVRLAERDKALALADEREKLAGRRYYGVRINQAQREWRQDRPMAMLNILDELQPRAGRSDWRNFEWHYLRRLSRGERLTLRTVPEGAPEEPADTDRSHRVSNVAYSSDGRYLAACTMVDVIVWDAQSGRLLQRFPFPSGKSSAQLAFRPGGKHLAIAWSDPLDPDKETAPSYLTVQEWQTGREVFRIPATGSGVAYDRKGKRFAAVVNKILKVFDADTGAELVSLEDKEYQPSEHFAFSSDGKRLAVGVSTKMGDTITIGSPEYFAAARGQKQVVLVWDLESARVLRTLQGHTGPIEAIAYSPYGSRLASGSYDGSIRVWDADTGVCVHVLRADTGPVSRIAFGAGDRTLISAARYSATINIDRGVAIVWDLNTGQQRRVLRDYAGSVYCVAARPGSTEVATVSSRREVKVCDLEAAVESRTVVVANVGVIGHTLFSADCRLAVRGIEGMNADQHFLALDVVALPSGRLLQQFTAHTSKVPAEYWPSFSLTLSPDGRWVATSCVQYRGKEAFREVTIWEVATGKKVVTLPLLAERVCLRRASGPPDWLLWAFSPDGSQLVTSGTDRILRIWDVQTGVELRQLQEHADIYAVAFAPDRTLASVGADRTVRVWDLSTGTHRPIPLAASLSSLERVYHGHAYMVFSPDSRQLAVAENGGTSVGWMATNIGAVHVIDLERTDEPPVLYHNDSSYLSAVGFSPDGERLAIGDGNSTIHIWDVRARLELLTLTGHDGEVNALAFTRDGRRLYSADKWGTEAIGRGAAYSIRIWDATPLPDDPAGRYRLGNDLARQGRHSEAEAEYREALRVKPDDPETHCNLGIVLREQGRFAEALTELRRGHELGTQRTDWRSPSAEWVRHAEALLEIDRRREAILRGQTAGIAPEDLLSYAVIRKRLGGLDEALKILQRVIALRPAVPNHRQRLVDWLAEIKDHARLARTALEMSRMSPGDWRECHWAALSLTRCVSLAKQDAQLSEAERQAAVHYYEKAIQEMLQEADRRGAFVVKDAFEAELLPLLEVTKCTVGLQSMNPWGAEKWSNGHQLFCGAAKGGSVGLEVAAPAKGDYRLDIYFTKAPDFGTVEVSIDGSTVGKPFDGFNPAVIPSGKIAFGTVTLEKGPHWVRFTAVDKNPKSSNYFMGIDCLKLDPLGAK